MNPPAQPVAERTVTVLQGELYITAKPEEVLSTILGSCVAVCMWDPVTEVGGMNHFLLPDSAGKGPDQVKYGAHAMELLINGLLRKGGARDRLVCKIFGGAAMGNSFSRIGEGNAAFARSFLREEGIPIEAESLGGSEARRVRFWATSGRVRMLAVPRTEAPADPVLRTPPPPSVAPKDTIELF